MATWASPPQWPAQEHTGPVTMVVDQECWHGSATETDSRQMQSKETRAGSPPISSTPREAGWDSTMRPEVVNAGRGEDTTWQRQNHMLSLKFRYDASEGEKTGAQANRGAGMRSHGGRRDGAIAKQRVRDTSGKINEAATLFLSSVHAYQNKP